MCGQSCLYFIGRVYISINIIKKNEIRKERSGERRKEEEIWEETKRRQIKLL